MKEFYGSASIVIDFNFSVESENIEEATDLVLGAEGMGFILINKKTDENIDIDINSWHIADEVGIGNVIESDLHNFDINEENA